MARESIEAPAVDHGRLLACLRRAGEPITLPEIARRLNLDLESEPILRRQMNRLEQEGVVFSHRRGRWTLHSRARFVVGRLVAPRAGFGFVVPVEESGPDLFIPGRRLNGARHGDRVLARHTGGAAAARRTARGGSTSAEGEILVVLERRSPYLAGLYRAGTSGGVVLPRDERLGSQVLIEPAPAGRASTGGPADGEMVWAEIVTPADRFRPARGKVVEVLGPPDAPGVAEAAARRTYELPGEFPADALAEARAWGNLVSAADRDGREDFTGGVPVTVDPATARDHDDAVGLERLETSAGPIERLSVHIADVSRYVPEDGPLDLEARLRGTSVYFPGRSIPMLPEALSSRLCSLLPGEVRLTQSVIIDFDDSGRRIGYRFADGVIRSAARLTYDELGDALHGADTTMEPSIVAMLKGMECLCRKLREARMRRGSLDLDLPETEVLVDEVGRPISVRPVEHTIAHAIIEEFMLAANEVVAAHLDRCKVTSLYRIHEDPDPARLDDVEEQLSRMGLPVRRTRGAATQRIRSLLAAFRGRPEEPAVSLMVLRSLKLARYSHEGSAHFGLAAPLYTHFTSPIRRYPDLVVHRILRETRCPGWTPRDDGPDRSERLAAVALECSRLERRADEAERDVEGWHKAVLMLGRVGEELQGRVTAITASSVVVAIDGLGVEGIIPVGDGATGGAEPRRRRRADRGHRAVPRTAWRLGDRLRVRVRAVDLQRSRVLLRPLSTG